MSTAKQMYATGIDEITNMVADYGDTLSILIVGDMGTGKSSILRNLSELPKFKEHVPCYFDATICDVGDLFFPDVLRVDGDSKCVKFVPNEMFGIHHGKPILLMVDEVGKAFPTVKNALNRVFLNRVLGSIPLPEGSVVFATSNKSGENVGDVLTGHSRNRVVEVVMRKPTTEEWIKWGINNKDYSINPIVLRFVEENPSVFDSFEDYENPEDNPYIYHPKRATHACITPRSLEFASRILDNQQNHSTNALTSLLMGAIGERGAMDLMRFNAIASKLPTRKEIIDDPMNAVIPDGASAKILLVYRALTNMDNELINSWITYMERLTPEEQGYYGRQVNQAGYKFSNIVHTNRKYMEWSTKNQHLFSADKL